MRSVRFARFALSSCLLVVVTSCGAETDGAASATKPSVPTPAPASAPLGPSQDLAASHVLIQYVGAERAEENITRTKEQALEQARQVLAEARSGADFAELARKYSDDPSGVNGGFVVFPSNRMVPQFAQACAALAVGQISDVTETPFGYHVIRREEVERASARHILVMYRGSQRAPTTMTRTKEEALTRAQEVLAKARNGAEFAQLALEYGDDPTRERGGDLGSFHRGAMVPEFDEAVFALETGGLSGVVESPFGYHVILRYE